MENIKWLYQSEIKLINVYFDSLLKRDMLRSHTDQIRIM